MTAASKRFARAHSAWLEPPDPPAQQVYATCLHCNDDIHVGEAMYDVPGAGSVHDDCAAEFAIQMIGAKRRVA